MHEGWGADFDLEKGGITRCATTQYAISAYFCGNEAVARQSNPGGRSSSDLKKILVGLDRLGDLDRRPQAIFRCNLHKENDESVGHTFVIYAKPDGTYSMYQSFIRHYTLRQYMAAHPERASMSHRTMMALLRNIQLIERASTWSADVDDAYSDLFHVRFSSTGSGDVGAQITESRIVFDFEVGCDIDADMDELDQAGVDVGPGELLDPAQVA